MPLQALPQARAAFEIHNSPLTENAVVGFETGYNIQEPSRLVIWEAQYGDFINGAQTMIDEFVVSARGKWGLRPSLVLLLPHAHEGQGPITPARGRNGSSSWPPTSTSASPTARPRRSTSICCAARRRCCRSIRCRSSC